MASARPWPFDDEDRPSGSVRPLSQADLQAILAHPSDDPDQLLAGTGPARLLSQLERHGWAILHDLAVPGSRANLDDLVIGPAGAS
jgi:hypothetical protein